MIIKQGSSQVCPIDICSSGDDIDIGCDGIWGWGQEELSDGGKEQTAVGRVRKWVSTDPVRNKKKNQLEFWRK